MVLPNLMSFTRSRARYSTGASRTDFDRRWLYQSSGTADIAQTYEEIDREKPKYEVPYEQEVHFAHELEATSNIEIRHQLIENLIDEVQAIFSSNRNEYFEDGKESQISRDLISVVEKYGRHAVMVLAALATSDKFDAEVVCEVVRRLGDLEDYETYEMRRNILEYLLLNSNSIHIRDGAIHGLTSMNDPKSITVLKQAKEKEQIKLFRKLIDRALENHK